MALSDVPERLGKALSAANSTASKLSEQAVAVRVGLDQGLAPLDREIIAKISNNTGPILENSSTDIAAWFEVISGVISPISDHVQAVLDEGAPREVPGGAGGGGDGSGPPTGGGGDGSGLSAGGGGDGMHDGSDGGGWTDIGDVPTEGPAELHTPDPPSPTPPSSEERSMTRAEAEAVPQLNRNHDRTRACWREVVKHLNQISEAVRRDVAELLGLALDANGFVSAADNGPHMDFPGGHALERHEGQVTLKALDARVLWKWDPAGLDRPPEHGIGAVATSYTSPEAFLAPLVAFVSKEWVDRDGNRCTWRDIVGSTTKVWLDPAACGIGAGDVQAVQGVRANYNGEPGPFSQQRNKIVTAAYRDGADTSTAELSVATIDNPLANGSCFMVIKTSDNRPRLITSYPEPTKEPSFYRKEE